MAEFDIRPGNRRHRTLAFKNAKGETGAVEGVPAWVSSDETLADMVVDADGMHGIIGHNDSVGDVIVTSEADGDLGLGVNRIVITDTFHMLAPLGSTGGESVVSEEEAIP
jgi:hypothetical protein